MVQKVMGPPSLCSEKWEWGTRLGWASGTVGTGAPGPEYRLEELELAS